MTRDYKHARAGKDRRKHTRRRSDQPGAPGWVWMLAGLVLGLCLAGLLYFKGLAPPVPGATTVRSTPPVETARKEAQAGKAEEPDGGPDFDFYEMLPNFEVVIPEKELEVRRDRDPSPVREQGSYILQVGAFQKYTDADRVKAKLALMGVESRIQKVSIDNQTWHRVRIGPVNDLDELNALRARLLDAGVDMLIIRSAR